MNPPPEILVVPAYPFTKRPDDYYSEEAAAAKEHNMQVIRLNFEDLIYSEEVRVYGRNVEGPALYRGWMLSVHHYTVLFEALAERGIHLVTTPEAYRTAHTLPGWYEAMKEFTPRSWIEEDMKNAEYPVIVKDYVKSAKHLWDEACFIPDKASAANITDRFVEERGEAFEGGLILREYVPDLTGAEVRSWWVDGELKLVSSHPDFPVTTEDLVNVDASQIESAMGELDVVFATADFAEREDGSWILIEVGDGGVSDMPESLDASELYDMFFDS